MAVSIKKFASLITGANNNSVVKIIFRYSSLKEKLDSEDQSWYFKMGIESSRKRLDSLKQEYEKIRVFFNSSSVDTLIEINNENNERKSSISENRMNSINYIVYMSITGQIQFIDELILLKSKTNTLEPIDYYFENPDDLLELVE